MKYLLMDTSTNQMVLMLQTPNETLDKETRIGKSDHQAYIIPLIDTLLKRNKLELKDLDGIVVGIGPGSYTGLRVGLMTAKMLSYATGIKLYQISSLAFLSSGYDDERLVWHDAKNNQGFSGYFKEAKLTKEERVRDLDKLSTDDLNILLTITPETIQIDGTRVIQHMKEVLDVYNIVPNYLRKTEAEHKLDQTSTSK